MSDETLKPKPDETSPAQAKRQAAAETITTIASTFRDQAGQAKQIAMATAGKTLDTLAPGQATGNATANDLREATAKLKLGMQQPGPTLIQRIINKISGG